MPRATLKLLIWVVAVLSAFIALFGGFFGLSSSAFLEQAPPRRSYAQDAILNSTELNRLRTAQVVERDNNSLPEEPKKWFPTPSKALKTLSALWNSPDAASSVPLPFTVVLNLPSWYTAYHQHDLMLKKPADWDSPGHEKGQLTRTLLPDSDLAGGVVQDPAGVNRSLNFDPLSFYGRYDEDFIAMKEFFFENKNGLIVDVGGNDGTIFSTSYALEKNLGWHSVVIEGDPVIASELPLERPDALSLNLILCDDFKVVHFSPMGTNGGIVEYMSDDFVHDWHPSLTESKLKSLVRVANQSTPVVECVPLGWVLGQLQLKDIDLLFIDLAGAEAPVLRSVDFSIIKASVVGVVTNPERKLPQQKREIKDHMKYHKYTELVVDELDVKPHNRGKVSWFGAPDFVPTRWAEIK